MGVAKETPIGAKINSLKILAEVEPVLNKQGYKMKRVKAQCDCGKIKDYYLQNIKAGLSTSCGCIRDKNVSEASIKHKIEDYIGKKINKLTILSEAEPRKGKYNKIFSCRRRVNYVCDCGNKGVADFLSIIKGATSSCGCFRVELHSERMGIHYDAVRGSEFYYLYTTWSTMVTRCHNPNYIKYHNYGGRGIKVCDYFRDWIRFKTWILENLGHRPKGHSLDRINNDGNYEPGNLRWATAIQQANNRRPYQKR